MRLSAGKEKGIMAKKDIFRTTVFGGYQKEDVMDYVRSLENEKETVKILTNKETVGMKAQLEQEKKANEELKDALISCKEQLGHLEEEQKQKKEERESLETLRQRLEEEQKQRKEERESLETLRQRLEEEGLARQQLTEERNRLQEKQSVWIGNLQQMQQDLREQEEEWRRRSEGFLSLEEKNRLQEQTVLQLQEQFDRTKESQNQLLAEVESLQEQLNEARLEKERLESAAAEYALEKESLCTEKERLAEECRRLQETVHNREARLRQLQDIERKAERLKKSNQELIERCRRMEAERKAVRERERSAVRKSGLGGVLERLSPAAWPAKQDAAVTQAPIQTSGPQSAEDSLSVAETSFLAEEPRQRETEEKEAREFAESEINDAVRPRRKSEAGTAAEPAAEPDTGSAAGRDTAFTAEPISEKKTVSSPKTAADSAEDSAAADSLFGEERQSAEREYRRHAEDVNRSIASAQERIAKMLEELQKDMDVNGNSCRS